MSPDCRDLRGFVALLEERGEFFRIAAEVDPELEVAAITDRVSKSAGGGRALCFEKVLGSPWPVLTNLFGSPRRCAWALGVEQLDDLTARLDRELAKAGSGGGAERLRRLTANPEFQPRRISSPPCREVVAEPPDLERLPALRAWPGDGGRYLTLPLVFTRDPETGSGNCGMYRVQLRDRWSGMIRWRPDSGGARHYDAWRARGEPMPVAIALGGDPALTYAAGAPLPEGVSEIDFAGYLRRRPLTMAKCLTSGLEIPADAEFVIEGVMEPGETAVEGPFGNHTGGYVPAGPAPLFHARLLTHRRSPLFPATVVGRPPMEDCYLARASERLFLAVLRRDHPELLDLRLPLEGIFHGCALLELRRESCGDARGVMRRLRQGGFLENSRLLVAFQEGVDIRRPSEAFWRAVNAVDPRRDLVAGEGRLDIDASSLPPAEVGPDPGTLALVERRWAEYGLG